MASLALVATVLPAIPIDQCAAQTYAREDRTFVVSSAGPYTRIADALAAAPAHATITVRPGRYREPTVIVRRPVTISGMPGAELDGEGARELLVVAADSVTVRGLTFRNTGRSQVEDRAALRVTNALHCTIERNTFIDTFFGIYLAKVEGCRIHANRLTGPAGSQMLTGNGIHLWSSRDVTITDNVIRRHRDGIYFEFVRHGAAIGNESAGMHRYGLHFMFSDSCRYERNRFVENTSGVAVMYTNHVVMRGNDFSRNRGPAAYGLLLKEISDSELHDNRFRDNSIGLHLEGANRNQIAGNRFEGNGWGVRMMADAQDNLVEGNVFARNTFDVATNSRSSTSTFRGNWWDRYRGYDLDRNGRGDVPFAPVRLFATVATDAPATVLLLRSVLVDLLDLAERVVPMITPEGLVDAAPLMRTPQLRLVAATERP
ncbi:MAG: nitrous oxide reductase family maturation protein NosD [Gemmatimonadaceae bacterium]|nr:nitrous oxide reductase family maturation protein NosD [Gemmatimonadaceae bacterium]